jgi:hypothetical protein
VQRDCLSVVLDLLGKRMGWTGEPSHVHPHGQIAALDMAGRDVRAVRVASDTAYAGAGAFGGAVAARRGDRGAVDLDKLGVVNVDPKRILDRTYAGI